MANPLTDVENALVTAGKWIAGASAAVTKLFAAEKKLAPATVSAVTTFVADVESLVALAAPAAGASGLNFAADSAAYAQFLVVKNDVVTLASVIEADLKAI
jgi:hypothetical protein